MNQYLHKIYDNSVQPRNFLGADNKDSIEVIFSNWKGYSLHEFIDRNKLLHPVIDFDLSVETLNIITPNFQTNKQKIYSTMSLEILT